VCTVFRRFSLYGKTRLTSDSGDKLAADWKAPPYIRCCDTERAEKEIEDGIAIAAETGVCLSELAIHLIGVIALSLPKIRRSISKIA
jgi:hypothetical protein